MSLINKDALRQMMVDSGVPFTEEDVNSGAKCLEELVTGEVNEVIRITKQSFEDANYASHWDPTSSKN